MLIIQWLFTIKFSSLDKLHFKYKEYEKKFCYEKEKP